MKNRRLYALALLYIALSPAVAAAAVNEGRAWGDIHLQTIDGAIYDFHPAGEFVASRSTAGDFEVQLRLEAAGFPAEVSIATAVALLVDTSRASIVVGRQPMLFVEGKPAPLDDGVFELPAGGRIESSERGYEIFWSDGSILSVDVRKRFLNVFLRPDDSRRNTLSGLFGNFNGVASDDVDATVAALGAGAVSLSNPAFLGLAQTLLTDDDHEAAVTREASLFDYRPGQTTSTFRRPKPTREATPEALPAKRRQQARQVCRSAGVTDPDILRACIVDVGYTRDESFATVAAEVQARDVSNWDSDLANQADSGVEPSS